MQGAYQGDRYPADSPHVTTQRITTFECSLGVLSFLRGALRPQKPCGSLVTGEEWDRE